MQKQESRGRESSPALLNKTSGEVQCKEKTRKKEEEDRRCGCLEKEGKKAKGEVNSGERERERGSSGKRESQGF